MRGVSRWPVKERGSLRTVSEVWVRAIRPSVWSSLPARSMVCNNYFIFGGQGWTLDTPRD